MTSVKEQRQPEAAGPHGSLDQGRSLRRQGPWGRLGTGCQPRWTEQKWTRQKHCWRLRAVLERHDDGQSVQTGGGEGQQRHDSSARCASRQQR